IVHRDIKPENIMRRSDRIVKILDFGIAKLLEQPAPEFSSEAPTLIKAETEMGILMGTVGYMSPEQARGLPVDERTDIWSLGVVLYEMLTQRLPFAGATRMDVLVSILEREPAPLLQLADDAPMELRHLQRVISQALSKERSGRYQTATEMLADLESVRQELSLSSALRAESASEWLRAARREQQQERDQKSGDEKLSAVPAGPAPSAILGSPTQALAAQEAGHGNAPRRDGLMVLAALALLVIVLAGIFLYNRAVARRQASATISAQAKETTIKLYTQMSEAEQLALIDEQEQRISAMMGDRPVKLNEEALRAIKGHVDRYVARTESAASKTGGDSLSVIYARVPPYVPLISRAFAARKVPVIIGIYLPMIESEYRACFENSIGAKGLFQFLPQTARAYGVAPEEMCDVEKMTPAAAHYIADGMAELGDDSESMTLVLLSYNRGAEWVRSVLRQLRSSDNYERNFWTLFANRDRLDETFRSEGAGYVPNFFAAAIIGENPRAFGLQIQPLSTLTTANQPAKP
ncbi:MAG TPA: serine/threonine-protein kinase, partial [Pyrinomonadaceae bacterium]